MLPFLSKVKKGMRRLWPKFVLRITLLYTLGGTLWILFTDRLLASFITDVKTLTTLQTYKGLLYVSFSALLIFLLLRHHVRRWKMAEAGWAESEEKYRQIVERGNDGIVIIHENRIQFANPQMAQLLGYSREELIGSAYESYLAPEELPIVRERYQKRMAGENVPSKYETILLRKDGSPVYVELNAGIIPYKGQPADLVFVRDITERKKKELELQKLNQTLAVLSQINQLIVRARTPQKLFEQACEIAVEQGGFLMAWIGILDPKTQKIKPVASAGKTEDDLKKLNICLNDLKKSQGPTATALSTGKPVVVNDIVNDPKMAPWRENALRLGYRSSGAFPLIVKKKVWGTLTLYASQPDFFGEEEIHLLDSLAKDIPFALEHLKQEKERKRHQAQLAQQFEELQRWHNVTLERETRILELKKEVNALLKRLGEPIRYPSAEKGISEKS